MGLLNHQQLLIMRGIPPIPGVSNSAEQPQVNIDLLATANGYSLINWSPNIPSLKQGGVWADSPISDGRQLVSGVNTNVIETMTLQLAGVNCAAFAAQFSTLNKMIQEGRAFHDTVWQIEPVYLQWWAWGAPAPQYALIYSIDTKITYLDSTTAQAELILSIERESYWRGVSPGDNPKRWTFRANNPPLSSSNAQITTGSDHLFNGSVNNRTEWNITQTALLAKNYVDVPATSIPGDAPALVEQVTLKTSGSSIVSDIIVGLTSKPDLITTAGAIRLPNYNLNGADGTTGTDTTVAADTGAPVRSSSGAASRLNCTFATVATEAARVTWTPASVGTYFDFATLRGRFMAFLRCRLSAAGTVTLRLTGEGSIGTFTSALYTLTDVGSGGTGNTTFWKAVYMGVITFPVANPPVPILDSGTGIEVLTSGATPDLVVLAARTSGTPVLYISDLILIPIDEGAWAMEGSGDLGVGNGFLLDDTGYYMHGKTDTFFDHQGGINVGARFSNFYLRPKERNRLVFLFNYGTFASTPFLSSVPNVYSVTLNIVPRWIGIRDV